MKRKVYSVALSDEEIINYLEDIPNKSHYIKELIRKDMTKEPFSEEQLIYIRKMIDEKLQGHVVSSKDDKQKETAHALDELLKDF